MVRVIKMFIIYAVLTVCHTTIIVYHLRSLKGPRGTDEARKTEQTKTTTSALLLLLLSKRIRERERDG